jgi:hypothetical protein
VTIHATNGVYLYGNVAFDVHGHCYYLEDGVEERNILEKNLAAYVHPIKVAGFVSVCASAADAWGGCGYQHVRVGWGGGVL